MHEAMDTPLALVNAAFGSAQPHYASLFTNRQANRVKVLIRDGVGIWLGSRLRRG